jgi:AcrR family transcriptional regulator
MTDRKRALLDSTVRIIAHKGVRGLRVEEVAKEAGVSVALIYHHFGDRSTLLASALLHIGQRAHEYTRPIAAGNARDAWLATVLGEIQDDAEIRDNSAAWGELRDAAIFDESLRPTLDALTGEWVDDLADIVRRGQADGSMAADLKRAEIGQRLTALVEGLSSRWLAGLISTAEAHALLEGAVARELLSG